MILLSLAGSYIALIAVLSCLGAIFLTIPGIMDSDFWLVALVDLLVNWVLVWELITICHFIEGVRCKNMFGMEIATLHI